MTSNVKEKKELHYGVKIICTLYGVILYLMAPKLFEMITDRDLSKNTATSISLVLAAILCFWVLPKVVGIPEKSSIGQNLHRIGFRKLEKGLMSIVLGILLALCTLTAMLIGSLLTGEYTFDVNTFSFEQIYFSFLPGIFEEIVFRGFIMAIFLSLYKNLKKAALIQCVVFTVLHLNDFVFNWLNIVDLLGVFVMAIGFTYVAYKTKNLLAGMVFHTLHDAFLFVVQPSQDIILSPIQALYFYGCLTLGVFMVILVTKKMTDQIDNGAIQLYELN